MRKKAFILAVLMFSLFTVNVSAAEPIGDAAETGKEVSTENVQIVEEIREVVEYDLVLNQPIATYEVNPDDYNGNNQQSRAISGSVYSGSYNSTAISLWNGLLANNIGRDYVAYRGSQYEYTIFFGDDFNYSNGRFTGTGTYYRLNTNNNSYSFTTGTDSFTVTPNGSYLYTNVDSGFPALDTERGLIYEQIQTVAFISLLAFTLLRWIFIGR